MGIKYLGLVYSMWISCDYKLHGDSKIDLLHVLCGVKFFFPPCKTQVSLDVKC
jgi:hypothetical protein